MEKISVALLDMEFPDHMSTEEYHKEFFEKARKVGFMPIE